MLSENQSSKNTCGTIPFIQNVENRQIGRNRKYISGFQIFGREGNREWLLEMGADFLAGGWKCLATR